MLLHFSPRIVGLNINAFDGKKLHHSSQYVAFKMYTRNVWGKKLKLHVHVLLHRSVLRNGYAYSLPFLVLVPLLAHLSAFVILDSQFTPAHLREAYSRNAPKFRMRGA